jgi:TolB-like protein/DNA-binding winged helix-turn-helix (wHTH) protein/Tfp pilus assembly protein PilF
MEHSPCLVRFGTFEVDLPAGELRKGGLKLKLTGQPFQVLAILLERPGEVVTREQLQKRLWPDTFVDVDHNLNTAINRIREVLGDSAESPRFVETLPRRGYRFIAPVEGTRASARGKRLLILAVLAAVIVVGALLALKFHPSPQTSSIDSIAVLPFVNASPDSNAEYLSDGVTEGLIHTLSRVPQLRVMARATVFHYKGQQADPRKVGRDLNVRAVLTGTVAQRGDSVHIDSALVDVRDGSELWGEGYDRKLTDVGNIQQEIARDISNKLQLRRSFEMENSQEKIRPEDSEAYLLYLRGRYYLAKQTTNDVRTSIDYFQEALSRNPNFARAYAGLADAYISLGEPWVGGLPPRGALQEAKNAAENAIKLSSDLSDAHVSLARAVLLHDWDWKRAEEEYQRAIALDPNSAQAHDWYTELLQVQGRIDEAVREAERAAQLDPLNRQGAVGWVFYTSRQYDQAEEIFRHSSLHLGLGWVYTARGQYPQALTELLAEENQNGRSQHVLASLGQVFALQGKTQEARKLLNELKSPYLIAQIWSGLGDREHTLSALEHGYEEHDEWMIYLRVDPVFDQFHSEPRFQVLLRRMNFPQ